MEVMAELIENCRLKIGLQKTVVRLPHVSDKPRKVPLLTHVILSSLGKRPGSRTKGEDKTRQANGCFPRTVLRQFCWKKKTGLNQPITMIHHPANLCHPPPQTSSLINSELFDGRRPDSLETAVKKFSKDCHRQSQKASATNPRVIIFFSQSPLQPERHVT
jgi:hypothetical protein